MYKSKILTLIAVVSIAIVCALPLYVKFIIWPSYDRFIIGKTEKDLQALASQMIRDLNLRVPLAKDTPVPPVLIEEAERVRRTVGLYKVKIFTPDGQIVYSSDPKEIGNFTRQQFFSQMLVDGLPRSELARKMLRQDGGHEVSHDIIETYVPIVNDGMAIGAFEIYYDVSDTNRSLHLLMESQLRVLVPAAVVLLLGALVSTYFASRSMQALAEAKERFREQAITDPLTGLLNYRGFKSSVRQQLKGINRGNTYAFLIFIDLNDFKRINDTLGHEAGDHALTEAAEILRSLFRESDTIGRVGSDIIGRLGGDEFAILTTQIGDLAEGRAAITARLDERIAQWNSSHDRGYVISMSYGIVPYSPQEPCSFKELLKKADALMYANKVKNKQRQEVPAPL